MKDSLRRRLEEIERLTQSKVAAVDAEPLRKLLKEYEIASRGLTAAEERKIAQAVVADLTAQGSLSAKTDVR